MNIVILHGWGHSSELWEVFASKFHSQKVLVLDLPGFGEEKLVDPNWTIADYADWVIEKLKARKIDQIALIGHSFGGKVATEIAIKKPALVKKLVLVAAPVLRRPSAYIKLKIGFYKSLKNILPVKAKQLFFVTEYKDASKNNLGEIFKKSVEYDRTKEIQKLKMPTLILWGEKDKTAPIQIGKEMTSLIKNSKFEMIKGAGHNVQVEISNILYGLVNNFLND